MAKKDFRIYCEEDYIDHLKTIADEKGTSFAEPRHSAVRHSPRGQGARRLVEEQLLLVARQRRFEQRMAERAHAL